VQRGYGTGNKGIDYQLTAADTVRSAASGEVVYAGSGIGGFRHLFIVKHDSVYLSAYSFDRPLAVREGQRVDVGERLVENQPGSTGRGALLHFEIRKNGAPVDPGGLLGGV
jgi:lipoprotein NlpD